MDAETLRERAAALAAAFADAAVRHAQRDACGVLWTEALAETGRRLDALEQASSAGAEPDISLLPGWLRSYGVAMQALIVSEGCCPA